MAEFQSITNEIVGLKEQRTQLEALSELAEWNESTIRQLVDTIRVISSEEIVVYLQDGAEIT